MSQRKDLSFLFFFHRGLAIENRAVPDDQALSGKIAGDVPWRLNLYSVGLDIAHNLSFNKDGSGGNFTLDDRLFADSHGAVNRRFTFDLPFDRRGPFEKELAVHLGSGTQVGTDI